MNIRISTQDRTVNFPAVSSAHPMVVAYFNNLPEAHRMAAYEKAITIGVMALRDERIAAFLAKTENELGANLEFLKCLFDTNQLQLKSAPIKGESGEAAVANALAEFAEARNLPDTVQLVGRTTGILPRNKTGDIVCIIGDADDSPRVVIECKLDKSIRLGDPSADGLTKGRSDTAWSQLVEARANRQADVAIMVFSADSTANTIGVFTDSVRYIEGIGYIVVIDLARSDFRPLAIAYELARQQALSKAKDPMDYGLLDTLARKLCADLASAMEIKGHLESAMTSCNAALNQVNSALVSANATHKAIQSYLKTGRLDGPQLLELLVPHKAIA